MKSISALLLVVVVSCSGSPRNEPTLPPLPLPTIPVVSVAQKPSERAIRPDFGQVIPTTPTTLPDTPCADAYPLFVEAGWSIELWDWASKILYRESRCNPDAFNHKSGDFGLWQINAASWCEPNKYNTHPAGWLGAQGIITDCEQLFDPATNMKAALAMYQYSENKNGTGMGWWPWRKTSG